LPSTPGRLKALVCAILASPYQRGHSEGLSNRTSPPVQYRTRRSVICSVLKRIQKHASLDRTRLAIVLPSYSFYQAVFEGVSEPAEAEWVNSPEWRRSRDGAVGEQQEFWRPSIRSPIRRPTRRAFGLVTANLEPSCQLVSGCVELMSLAARARGRGPTRGERVPGAKL
jgi:hypothetical protein